jgi:hypothetical protein
MEHYVVVLKVLHLMPRVGKDVLNLESNRFLTKFKHLKVTVGSKINKLKYLYVKDKSLWSFLIYVIFRQTSPNLVNIQSDRV